MTHDHEDPEFDRWLQRAAKSYHTPPATPRDAMWERIEHARRQKRVIELRPWARWALAAAAVLLLGIGIGRWTANPDTSVANGTPVAATPDSGADSAQTALVYRMAATQYFSRAEAFLTGFRSEHGTAQNVRLASQARDLLLTTQLMLDSPAGNDPRLRGLLEDLELVLVQISQLNATGHGARESDYITQSMNQSNMLPKLRSAIPAGPVPVRTEGAL